MVDNSTHHGQKSLESQRHNQGTRCGADVGCGQLPEDKQAYHKSATGGDNNNDGDDSDNNGDDSNNNGDEDSKNIITVLLVIIATTTVMTMIATIIRPITLIR